MYEWWKKEFHLLNRYNLTPKIISKILDENYITLKESFNEFLELIKDHKLIIFSGGIKNILEDFFKDYGHLDVDIIANKICFDEKDFINESKLIVSTNKDELYLEKHHPKIYHKIKDKPLIIIGDNFNDSEIFLNKKDSIRILLVSKEIDKKELKKYAGIDFFVENGNGLKEVMEIINSIIK